MVVRTVTGNNAPAESMRALLVEHPGDMRLVDAEYAETGFTHQGAFADYVLVPARLVHVLPPGTDLAAAALLEPAACVANGLLDGALAPGLDVAVVGAGTLGLLAVAMAALASPSGLVVVGTRADRLALARRPRGTHTADRRDAHPLGAVARSVHPRVSAPPPA